MKREKKPDEPLLTIPVPDPKPDKPRDFGGGITLDRELGDYLETPYGPSDEKDR